MLDSKVSRELRARVARLDKTLDINDHVGVMKGGEVVAERRATDVLGPELPDMMTRRGLHAGYYSGDRQAPSTLDMVLDPEGLGSAAVLGSDARS